MKTKKRFIPVLLGIFCYSAASWACESLISSFDQALETADLERAEQVYRQVRQDLTCSGKQRKSAKFLLSEARALEVHSLIEDEMRLGSGRLPALGKWKPEIEQAMKPAAGWRASSLLGEFHYLNREYDLAVPLLNKALILLDNEVATPNPPDPQTSRQLYRMGELAELFAKDYAGGGLASRGAPRGFKVTKVITPITFDFGSTDLTKKGLRAVAGIFKRIRNLPEITLIGHTDPAGSEQANQELSLQRARKVASLLADKGYSGRIHTRGKGETQPIQLPNQDQMDDQQICQVLRRVELQIKPGEEADFNYVSASNYNHLRCH